MVRLLYFLLLSCLAFIYTAQDNDWTAKLYSAMEQATTTIFNVTEPHHWEHLIENISMDTSYGQNRVNSASISNLIKDWLIPEGFQSDLTQDIIELMSRVRTHSYLGQSFMFWTSSDGLLTSFIVAVTKHRHMTNSNLTISLLHVTIRTKIILKNIIQIREIPYTKCSRCLKCMWIADCCCENAVYYSNSVRSLTNGELNIVKQKAITDQSIWFHQQYMPTHSKKNLLSITGRDGYD